MFEERSVRKQFLSAPPSVGSTIASLLEPVVAAGMLALFHELWGYRMDGVAMALAILLLVLMFPGVNRFGRTGVGVGIDIILSWVWVLSVLALLGYATNTLATFDTDMLIAWGIATPLVQWALVAIGTAIQRHLASLPDARRPAVIIGAGRMGMRVAQMLKLRQAFGHDLLGVFDDRSADRVNLPEDAVLLGTLRQLPEYIEAHSVKDVFITLPLTSQPRIQSLLESLQNTTSSIHFVPDIFGVSVIQGRLEDMGGVPVVGLMVAPFTGINGFIKRVSDIVLATLILILISPILLVLAIGVKVSSPGPVIFRQRRTGLDGEIIEVYKFRSMRTTDDGAVVKQATRDDPRITSFGAVIRKTSLDELPQFVNVLQGRMSIVGPRPHAVAHNEEYRRLIKAYMVRHKVKPGITGWAQVNGHRGETPNFADMQARVDHDIWYAKHLNLLLDLKILAVTPFAVFGGKNAY